MAHTSDRTLLAALGFADPDKGDRRHTLACQYLCQPEVALRLWARIYPSLATAEPVIPDRVREGPDPEHFTGGGYWARIEGAVHAARHASATMEVAITKDRGFLIGFWDVVLNATASIGLWKPEEPERGPRPGNGFYEGPILRRRFSAQWERGSFGVMRIEVKARPVDVAAIARQIETYTGGSSAYGGISGREIAPIVVATCYPMPKADRDTLAAKRIHHVYLGDAFTAYCREREADTGDHSDDL